MRIPVEGVQLLGEHSQSTVQQEDSTFLGVYVGKTSDLRVQDTRTGIISPRNLFNLDDVCRGVQNMTGESNQFRNESDESDDLPAPRSPRSIVVVGPASTRERSTTLTPDRGSVL